MKIETTFRYTDQNITKYPVRKHLNTAMRMIPAEHVNLLKMNTIYNNNPVNHVLQLEGILLFSFKERCPKDIRSV